MPTLSSSSKSFPKILTIITMRQGDSFNMRHKTQCIVGSVEKASTKDCSHTHTPANTVGMGSAVAQWLSVGLEIEGSLVRDSSDAQC